ncbi:hypothetical protein GCM10009665_07000 [Kitasatospora nipponensis]|uniref:Uncharacterized protein n=1 Tax=Kitasatospora nipponensis TaxID=258049 RepID=A0ABP4GIP6_9ACTN
MRSPPWPSRSRDSWKGDARSAALDLAVALLLGAVALTVPAHWLLAVAVLWAGVGLRQGHLAVRARRAERSTGRG